MPEDLTTKLLSQILTTLRDCRDLLAAPPRDRFPRAGGYALNDYLLRHDLPNGDQVAGLRFSELTAAQCEAYARMLDDKAMDDRMAGIVGDRGQPRHIARRNIAEHARAWAREHRKREAAAKASQSAGGTSCR